MDEAAPLPPGSPPVPPGSAASNDVVVVVVAISAPDHALTTCPVAFMDGMRRIKRHQQVIMFWNFDRTLRLMLRYDPVGDAAIAMELIVVDDEDMPHLQDCCDNEYEGYYAEDNDDFFVIDSFYIPDEAAEAEAAVYAAMRKVNAAYSMFACGCRRYFVREPGESMCALCQLSGTPESLAPHECIVCSVPGPRMHMSSTKCCGNLMHKGCLARWGTSCMFCRGGAL